MLATDHQRQQPVEVDIFQRRCKWIATLFGSSHLTWQGKPSPGTLRGKEEGPTKKLVAPCPRGRHEEKRIHVERTATTGPGPWWLKGAYWWRLPQTRLQAMMMIVTNINCSFAMTWSWLAQIYIGWLCLVWIQWTVKWDADESLSPILLAMFNSFVTYHRFRWYATLENKTPAKTFPKFPSVLRVIDRSDRNAPITAR